MIKPPPDTSTSSAQLEVFKSSSSLSRLHLPVLLAWPYCWLCCAFIMDWRVVQWNYQWIAKKRQLPYLRCVRFCWEWGALFHMVHATFFLGYPFTNCYLALTALLPWHLTTIHSLKLHRLDLIIFDLRNEANCKCDNSISSHWSFSQHRKIHWYSNSCLFYGCSR